jgi:hypothetical protein
MKSGRSRPQAACRHCGLESAASTDHASARECIGALEREVQRLRAFLRHGRFSVMGMPKPAADPANGAATSPRLLQIP